MSIPISWASLSDMGSEMKQARACSLKTSLGNLSPKSWPVHFWFW